MEYYSANRDPYADHGPELSPAERVHDLSQPQRPPSRDEKTGLGINHRSSDAIAESSKRKRKFWLIGAVVAAVVVIVLAVALPVGLTRRKKSR